MNMHWGKVFITTNVNTLLGTASLLTMAGVAGLQDRAFAGEVAVQQPQEIPENVLVTGSLIRGTVAVGVPVTNLGPMDFAVTGAVKAADLFKNFPAANVASGSSSANSAPRRGRESAVNLRGLDQRQTRELMMIDGMRFPPQDQRLCSVDPSIIPTLALDHIDVLVDGASATYGSDAISGVINLILKRNYDGAQTQVGFSHSTSGRLHFLAGQLWGRTWDGGQITLTYEWYDDSKVKGTANSNFTVDYRPWGLDDQSPVGSSLPGTISTGGASPNKGTGCTNCYAIPKGTGVDFPGGIGPTAPFSASTLSWATLIAPANSGANGAQNVFDPLKIANEDAAQQRNSAVITIDQRLTKDISFYGSAFYSNRRAETLAVGIGSPLRTLTLSSLAVPTTNPYYPTGGAPTNLRISYHLGAESTPQFNAYELAARYQGGLNISLPGEWAAQVYYSQTYYADYIYAHGNANPAAVSAALGWTIKPLAASGTGPSFGTWTKPANVPYLNLFCDPTQFLCNSKSTIDYIGATRINDEKMWVNEKGTKFDGPLFDLPGGTVKAAIGATYTSVNFAFITSDNTGTPNLIMSPVYDSQPYNVWATFAQVNVPVFGESNAMPFFRRLDIEGSWRHDQYNGTLSGGTSNPKVGFTWLLSEDAGFSFRGAWGTSFRFANAGEYSTATSAVVQSFNLSTSIAVGASTINLTCTGGAPAAGSAADVLFKAGFACGSQPGGMAMNGGPQAFLRPPGSSIPLKLKPESATNWSGGFQFAPTAFLRGLDIQATYYIIKINGVLQNFQNITDTAFGTPGEGFHFIMPSTLGCAGMDATPALCAPFQDMVFSLLTHPRNSTAQLSAQTSIYWISDGGTLNSGSRKVDGIDFTASYDWDMGNLGAFNTGLVGTYYLHDYTTLPDGSRVDGFHTDLAPNGNVAQLGVPTLPYFRYRGRLGWSSGAWSVTGFMDYQSHFYHTEGSPPNVNGNFCASSAFGAQAGGTFPCAISNYTNLQPPWYSFDLSIGYDTGEEPANDYLKRIGINFVIQNIADKHPEFQYGPSVNGRGPAAFDPIRPNSGRTLNLLLTKTW